MQGLFSLAGGTAFVWVLRVRQLQCPRNDNRFGGRKGCRARMRALLELGQRTDTRASVIFSSFQALSSTRGLARNVPFQCPVATGTQIAQSPEIPDA